MDKIFCPSPKIKTKTVKYERDKLKHVNNGHKYFQAFNFVIRGLQFDNHFAFHKNCEATKNLHFLEHCAIDLELCAGTPTKFPYMGAILNTQF